MNIIEMKISELIPYEKNPRLNDEAVKHVANSIEEFGFKVPIVIDSNNVIVAGHTRLKAAEKLGLKEVPVIIADDLTPQQIKAFRLADNKTSEFAQWDNQLLTSELIELQTESFDMTPFGFADEISDFNINGQQSETEVVEDEYDVELPEEPKAQLGDIYILGNHRLMCGDSTSEEDVSKLMDGKKAVLALTDPPYGIDVVQHDSICGHKPVTIGNIGANNIVKANSYLKVKGDETTETAQKNYEIIKNVSDNQILFGGNYFTDFLFPSRCWIVWDKQNTGNFADAELAWTSFNKGVKLYHFMWNGLVREGSRKVEGVHRVHPTQKPVGLMGKILNDFSKEGDVIVDTFGGSGSTLIACEQLDRKCYMMEYEPAYVDVIIDRWETFTGKKAVKL